MDWAISSSSFDVAVHELRWRSAGAQQLSHALHGLPHVLEERLVTGAEVVLSGFAVRRGCEAVLRATAVAGEAHVTVQAELCQRVTLVLAELSLRRKSHQFE